MYYVVYKDNANQWRWHLVAANNEIIAVSSESYNSSTLFSAPLSDQKYQPSP